VPLSLWISLENLRSLPPLDYCEKERGRGAQLPLVTMPPKPIASTLSKTMEPVRKVALNFVNNNFGRCGYCAMFLNGLTMLLLSCSFSKVVKNIKSKYIAQIGKYVSRVDGTVFGHWVLYSVCTVMIGVVLSYLCRRAR